MAMVASPSPPSPSSRAAKPDADAASDVSSTSSGDRRDADVMARLSTMSEEYRLLFRLPADEVLVQDFNCALQENILLQGHMYLFVHHICFYSNIFGYETKKTISFNEITCVRKAKTAAIFPNAIEIATGVKKHFFGSFLSRDEAYRLIVDGWAQHNSEVKALLERQDSRSETGSQDISNFVLERVQSTKGSEDDGSISSRIKELNVLEQSRPSLDGNTSIDLEPPEFQANGAEEKTTWIVEDVDAPKVPDHFTLAAEAKFPILLEDFFDLFVSDSSIGFVENFHSRCGDKDFQCTSWQRHAEFGHVRNVSFLHPVKIYLGAKFGQCQEAQKFRVYKNSHLMIETSQQVSDVPFADYFQVEGIWDVQQDKNGENSCTMRVYSNVAFSKKTIFRGKIEQSTKDEYRDVCGTWISMANDLLKQRPVGQLKEAITDLSSCTIQEIAIANQSACTIQEVEVQVPKKPEESHEKSQPTPSAARITQDLRNSCPTAIKVVHDNSSYPGATKAVQGSSNYFSLISSLFTELWLSSVSYFKRQSPLFQVSVAILAILLLLQISFIVHVTRLPEVHVVIHDSARDSNAGFGLENIQWLEKRLSYLKNEMLLVETRMDSMRHEYAALKSYLQRLEQLKDNL